MTIEQAQNGLAELDRLEKCPAWQQFAEELRRTATAEAAQHESIKLTALERAEHLHAMKLLRELAGNGTPEHPGWIAKQREKYTAALRPKR